MLFKIYPPMFTSVHISMAEDVWLEVADWLAPLNVSAVTPLHSGIVCVISLGLSYIFMGEVDDDGRGKIAPQHFVMGFKAKNQRAFNALKTKRC